MNDATADFMVHGMSPRLRAALGKPCTYCGREMGTHALSRMPTRDHIFPRELGGTRSAGNIVIVCQGCNLDKGNRTILAWYVKLVLRRDERVPRVAEFVLGRVSSDVHDNGDGAP